jgi:mono/diheme cytochrome c family protein
MAAFDRPLDASSVSRDTFVLERSGGDGTFDDGNEVLIAPTSITVPTMNTSSAVLDLSTAIAVPDTYRVTLVGTGPATILDLDANALDGDFSGAFPSGDGAQGGNFTADFTVAGVAPTLDSIQANVFTPICSGCHTGGGATLPSSMNLSNATASHAALVGVASTEQPAVQRVSAGDPDASYVVRKLEGTPGITGSRMPLNGTPLSAELIADVRAWITAGAPNN